MKGEMKKERVFQSLPFIIFVLWCGAVHGEVGFCPPWGKDSDLKVQEISPPKPKLSLPVWCAEQVILFHQNVISPVDGPRSHFRPTSSRYMRQAMVKHGFVKGFIMGCDRLLRENEDPWVYRQIEIGGQLYKYDPVSG
jgi:putative component of membrane protein insertase Oxa1/YidC/SpoIIIJ protein YidD